MSDDKITITMDEVDHATPVPGASSVSPDFISGYVPPVSDREVKPKRVGLFVGIGVAAVAFLCIACMGIMALVGRIGGPGGGGGEGSYRTVSDYRTETIREIETELAKPDSKLRKRIEDAHLTVTVKSTKIVRCDVTTIDGSDKAGQNDSNIDRVSMLIRFNWEGFIDSGYSDLRLVYDSKNDRLEKSEIEYTTAIVNIEDPSFWSGVGALIGSML